jgi:hypothetical protein
MFSDEDAERAWFKRARWPNGPECYHCGVIGNAAFMPKTKFWHCEACKKQLSVTAATLMHRTHLPLLTWAQAIYKQHGRKPRDSARYWWAVTALRGFGSGPRWDAS